MKQCIRRRAADELMLVEILYFDGSRTERPLAGELIERVSGDLDVEPEIRMVVKLAHMSSRIDRLRLLGGQGARLVGGIPASWYLVCPRDTWAIFTPSAGEAYGLRTQLRTTESERAFLR